MTRWKRSLEISKFSCPDLRSFQELDLHFKRITTLGEAFVTRWEILSPVKFVYPIAKEAAYNIASVDWGDKSPLNGSYIHTANTTIIPLEHEYKNPGIYDITVLGTVFETFFIASAQVATFRGVVHGGKLGSLITLLCMKSCKKITVMDNSDWTRSVKIMTNLFANTNFNLPIGSWDVSNVIMMNSIFNFCKFNQSISNWNTINVTTLKEAFYLCDYDFPLNWNVSSVKDFSGMFFDSDFNQPLAHWDVSSATNMASMFGGGVNQLFNHPLTYWNVSNVTNFRGMFNNSIFNHSLSHWNVSSCEDFSYMFFGNQKFNQPLKNWKVISATNMLFMFSGAILFNQDLSSWRVDRVKDIRTMFHLSSTNVPIWNMPALISINNETNSDNKMPLISATALKFLTAPLNLSSSDYDNALNFYAAQTEMKSVNWNVSFASCTIAGKKARMILEDDREWTITNQGPDWGESSHLNEIEGM
jgi:hypothetical protein